MNGYEKLGDSDLELLTAYVDGELDSIQLKKANRLIEESPAANLLLQNLRSDRDGLRAMPVVSMPTDLSTSILAQIAQAPSI